MLASLTKQDQEVRMHNLNGKSFIARIESLSASVEGTIGLSEEWGPAKNGWLICESKPTSLTTFRFDYIEHTPDRHHYHVSVAAGGGTHEGARVGISRNGYLGAYSVSAVTDFWKVEVLRFNKPEQELHFTWRDHQGHRVSLRREYEGTPSDTGLAKPNSRFIDYLSVDKNAAYVLRFKAQILEWVSPR